MSLFSRRNFLALGAASALTACGFTPAYGPNGQNDLFGEVAINAPATSDGYVLEREMTDRLGAAQSASYQLDLFLSISDSAVGVTKNQEITRYHAVGEVDFTLTDAATGEVLQSGSVEGFTAYSATSSTVDAITTPRDAHRRVISLLSDRLVARLSAAQGTR